jgi:transglutaminase-like putative cysteine protease
MNYYLIRHTTAFHYSQPISESMMELRLEPRSDETQRCLRFQVVISPKANLNEMRDYLGNSIHTFDVPSHHVKLAITSESLVETMPASPVPDSLPRTAWADIDALVDNIDYFDMMVPSYFVQRTARLEAFAQELNAKRRADPLSLLREINARINDSFEYERDSTDVDSPIDDVLTTRQGVCQDFVHVMLALVRGLGIPARYVSGYLFHRTKGYDRSASDASHAWLEAYLPSLGWVSFDPTNNTLGTERHIRVAYGRDYADVPPTKGVFRGEAETKLDVEVKVEKLEHLPIIEEKLVSPVDWSLEIQQQQQQQQ